MFNRNRAQNQTGAFWLMAILTGSMVLSQLIFPQMFMRLHLAADFHVFRGQWWRLLTYMWAHEGWQHLISNQVPLLVLGWATIQCYGARNWLLIYLASGVLGALASITLIPGLNIIGASAAMMGIFGMAIASGFRCTGTRTPHFDPILVSAVLVLALVNGLGDAHIANLAHCVGALSGITLGLIFPIRYRSA